MLYGIKGKKSENKYLASQAYRSKLVREFWRTLCNVYIERQKKVTEREDIHLEERV